MADWTLEEYYNEYRGDEDGVDKKQTYEILCAMGKCPTVIDVKRFWSELAESLNDYPEKEEDIKGIGYPELEELYNRLGDGKIMIKKALELFDKDKNGKIDKDELKGMMKTLDNDFYDGDMFDEEFLQQTFDHADKDGSGFIEINELIYMLTGGNPGEGAEEGPKGALLTVSQHEIDETHIDKSGVEDD